MCFIFFCCFFFFFQAEDGIRDAQESRGLGDVYKRQTRTVAGLTSTAAAISVRVCPSAASARMRAAIAAVSLVGPFGPHLAGCLLYTSDAADEEDSVDLGG